MKKPLLDYRAGCWSKFALALVWLFCALWLVDKTPANFSTMQWQLKPKPMRLVRTRFPQYILTWVTCIYYNFRIGLRVIIQPRSKDFSLVNRLNDQMQEPMTLFPRSWWKSTVLQWNGSLTMKANPCLTLSSHVGHTWPWWVRVASKLQRQRVWVCSRHPDLHAADNITE